MELAVAAGLFAAASYAHTPAATTHTEMQPKARDLFQRNVNNLTDLGVAKARNERSRQLVMRPHNSTRHLHRLNPKFHYQGIERDIGRVEYEGLEDKQPYEMQPLHQRNNGAWKPPHKINVPRDRWNAMLAQ